MRKMKTTAFTRKGREQHPGEMWVPKRWGGFVQCRTGSFTTIFMGEKSSNFMGSIWVLERHVCMCECFFLVVFGGKTLPHDDVFF